MTHTPPADGSIVEVYVKGHGPHLGIVDNIPPRRVVGRVTVALSGNVAIYPGGPDDGRVCWTPTMAYRTLAPQAFAGWALAFAEPTS